MAYMVAFRIGHSRPLVYFQNVANNVNFETQDCEHFSGEAETSQHLLCKCIQIMTFRMRIIGKLYLKNSKLQSYLQICGTVDKTG